ncbi:hypothetical protein MMC25_008126 [Agyrium rufum]|nr:hypothetical protein [Agyrium rufum]
MAPQSRTTTVPAIADIVGSDPSTSTDPHHRKIDLQSSQDLTYLLSNIRRHSKDILDLHIPPPTSTSNASSLPKGASSEDEQWRQKVESYVQAYIQDTLKMALPSLSINGMGPSASLIQLPDNAFAANGQEKETEKDGEEDNYEPYDIRMAEKVRNLYAQLEEETTAVAESRREAPQKAAGWYAERLKVEMVAEEGRVEAESSIFMSMLQESANELEGIEMPRSEIVKETWERSVRGLEGLGGGLTGGMAKIERARGGVSVLEGM